MKWSTRLAFVPSVALLSLLAGCGRDQPAAAPVPVLPAAEAAPSEFLKRLAQDRKADEITRRLLAKAPKLKLKAHFGGNTSKLDEFVQVVMNGGWESSDQYPAARRIVLAEIEAYLLSLVAEVGAVVTDPVGGRTEDGFVFGYTLGTTHGTVKVSDPRNWKPQAGVGDFWIEASEAP